MTTRMLPNALHFSEFQGGFHGTCGETALATAMVCSTPPIEDTQEAIDLMLSMTHEMISLGWASSSGSATTAHLRDEAVRRGFTYDTGSFISFQQPLPNATTFHNLLLSTAGVKPIIIEIARAGVLEGNSVQYHFICIVGITDAGYICNDGDNPNITSHLVTYSWNQIESAVPCGVLVLDMKEGSTMTTVPAGWTDDGVTLKAPNGHTVTQGFRAAVLAWPGGWEADNVPLENARGESPAAMGLKGTGGTRQVFARRLLGWTDAEGVQSGVWLGQMFLTEEATATSRSAEIASLDNQVAALQAQVAALKSQPVAAPIDPSVRTALSAAANLLQPYGATLSDIQAAIKTLP